MAEEEEQVPLDSFLNGNQELLDQKDCVLVRLLIKAGQGHLFHHWPHPGKEDEKKKQLVAQLQLLDSAITGGLVGYLHRSKQLLGEAQKGVNPLTGFVPSVPSGVKLDYGSEDFKKFEEAGVLEAGKSAFVLVAGGLGERLGYSGIKIALPSESATGKSYLQLYAETILAIQAKCQALGDKQCSIPFVLMTSDDTHSRTVEFLESNGLFGLQQEQVTFLKQEKVPCLSDNEGRVALSDPYTILTKPHGHGDIHALLHSSGLVQKWKKEGLTWVCFYQDTNGLGFNGLFPVLGVSSKYDYDMNSLAVPRKAKEAFGGIAKLHRASDGFEMTINVEYNQLDPLLKATTCADGDVNDETGFSPFPGNINELVLKIESYCKQLEESKGIISEFVNPKYTDETRTSFKSPTRLECMMQDYPRTLPKSATVGFTLINQVWATFAPVKNSIEAAKAKVAAGLPPHSAATGEAQMYECSCRTLLLLGADIGDPKMETYSGLSVAMYPRIIWSPSFALTFKDLEARIKGNKLRTSSKSVLILEGNVQIDGLDLDGCLVAKSSNHQKVIQDMQVANRGWEWVEIEGEQLPEDIRIRGFKVVKHETQHL